MSATKTRIPLDQADELAAEVIELLTPVCARIAVAGSIRRRRPEIGDLEIVCVPNAAEQQATILDLFGAPLPGVELPDPVTILADRLRVEGVFGVRLDKNDRPAWGPKYKRATYRGMGLDLFSVLHGRTAQWGVILLIRTGSAEFSHRLVTPVEQGGWMPRGMWVRDGALWRNGQMVEMAESEAGVFAAINREWVDPERREVR